MTLQKQLESTEGLTTSILNSNEKNAEIITFILRVFFTNELELSPKVNYLEWSTVYDCPTNFIDYKYRIKRNAKVFNHDEFLDELKEMRYRHNLSNREEIIINTVVRIYKELQHRLEMAQNLKRQFAKLERDVLSAKRELEDYVLNPDMPWIDSKTKIFDNDRE